MDLSQSLGLATEQSPVIVWTKPACVQCNAVKRKLTEAGVEFEHYDLTSDEYANEFAYFKDKLGVLGMPLTEYGGAVVPGMNPGELDQVIARYKELHP